MAAGFLREHWRTVAIAFVVVLFVFAAFRGGSGDGDGDGDGASGRGSEGSTEETTPPVDAPTVPATDESDATVTTLTPPDVPHERPAVDLATPPPATDPVEVARWWAATYAVHVGAEAPADLAGRLAPLTTDRHQQTLRQVPLAASYDAPLELQGSTGNEIASGAGTKVVRVTVETVQAVVVYDVTLTESPPGTWLVSDSVRL